MTRGETTTNYQRVISLISKELPKINKKKMNVIKNEKLLFTYHFALLLNSLDFYCLF